MISTNLWSTYPVTYRAKEMKILASWISAGESGSVVGLSGSGRSNLLGFLCHRPEVLQIYLLPGAGSVALIPVDLNSLPANDLSTLYRVILRSFYRVKDQFDQVLQQKITDLYQKNKSERDPFLSQSALQELLLLFQARQIQVVLVLNRFDRFCQMTTSQMVNTLRSLRDDFKETLYYITGMSQEVAYLPDPSVLGDMYELLDNFICWVGAMSEADCRYLIARATHTASHTPSEKDISIMLTMTGRHPALLRATCSWWLTVDNKPPHSEWMTVLPTERSIQHRLAKIWSGLTQEEQYILSELQKLQTRFTDPAIPRKGNKEKSRSHHQRLCDFAKQHNVILTCLADKGLCQHDPHWRISAQLLAGYIDEIEGRGRGKIWLDQSTGEIYQGETQVKGLTSLERSVLTYFIKFPRYRHTKTDLIINTWPDELRAQGVTDNSLYQVILNVRKAIEPSPNQPSYVITWRGKPEGGYQFFPEGRPG